MPNVEWEVAHDLVTPFADIKFNQVEGGTNRLWQLEPDGYKIVPAIRATLDNISQADGSVLHPRYKTGLVATLKVTYKVMEGGPEGNAAPACETDLREMHELLTGALNSIRSYGLGGGSGSITVTDQRLIWTPSGLGGARRMLDQVQCLAWTDPVVEDNVFTSVTFSVECPFPYAMDLTQIETDIADGGLADLVNDGTADTFPVVRMIGPFTGFVLANETTGLELSYDGTRPGATGVAGGHYAEIDCFRGTIFLDGSSSDLIAGLDPTITDFFPLAYEGGGTNLISTTGAAAHILWNPAWA